MSETTEEALNRVNPYSKSSDLRITDLRFVDIAGAPMHCILLKIYTNQGIVGLGEVRDAGTRISALLLKSRLLGENPCHIDRLFRRLKQFGGHGRQGGGVSGIEIALWDLVGKAYGVPVYQLLGGRFRDGVCLYCDTDGNGKPDGKAMGEALKKRMELGYWFLKMDFGVSQLMQFPDALSGAGGLLDELKRARGGAPQPGGDHGRPALVNRRDLQTVPHPFTGLHFTERGLDRFEEFVSDVRSIIGSEVPLAVDHLGHIAVEDCIRLAQRLEKYNLAWLEDPIPWQYTEQYVRLRNATTVPICTGEDIYLKEGFRPLLESGGVSVIHPDVLTAGGVLETKKIADLAAECGVPMAIHMAESPVGCLAAAHVAVASENFLALEFHSVNVSWWEDIAVSSAKPIVDNGYIAVSDRPGLGIDDFDDEVLREHLHPQYPELWAPTEEWDRDRCHDRTWS